MSRPSPATRVAIVGSGIIGLTAAYELSIRRGVSVTLYDMGPVGRGASWAAAGMLAPAFEAAGEQAGHPLLFDLCLASSTLWPDFAADLSARTGLPTGHDLAPSLALARTIDEAVHLNTIADRLARAGLPVTRLSANEAHDAEPALGGTIVAGLELPTDTRIDNRATLTALIAALSASPKVRLVCGLAPLEAQGGRVMLRGHDAILIAAGWRSAAVKVEAGEDNLNLVNWAPELGAIDCHGGQMLSLAAGRLAPRRVLRAGRLYLVPQPGRLVIGATVEPGRAVDAPEDAVIEALWAEAIALCPPLADASEIERWAGTRPGTPDRAPLIGATSAPDVFIAAGHYRNGMLLAPITATLIADAILGEAPTPLARAFAPGRVFAATA